MQEVAIFKVLFGLRLHAVLLTLMDLLYKEQEWHTAFNTFSKFCLAFVFYEKKISMSLFNPSAKQTPVLAAVMSMLGQA